ncbi:MAG: flagellar type III secretion system pore protein FliP [Bacteroidota bacterium]
MEIKHIIIILAALLLFGAACSELSAQQPVPQQQPQGAQTQAPPGSAFPLPNLSVNINPGEEGGNDLVLTLQILTVITVLTMAPSILVLMTSFTRIIVVFHFLKQALGTHTQPPSQLLTGLAMFLTFFVMEPVLDQANRNGIQPYLREEITQAEAVDNIVQPFREFMLKYTDENDLALFLKLSGEEERPNDISEVSTWTIIPAYAISELRVAFQIGFMLFIPFLILDMIIASTLMSLGMFLLPPQLISLPIKILLFILVDGWYLIIDSLMKSIVGG